MIALRKGAALDTGLLSAEYHSLVDLLHDSSREPKPLSADWLEFKMLRSKFLKAKTLSDAPDVLKFEFLDSDDAGTLHPLNVEARILIDSWTPQRVFLSNVPARLNEHDVSIIVGAQLLKVAQFKLERGRIDDELALCS